MVRAWIEESPEERALRARITETVDVSSHAKVEHAAASREDIVRAVEEWLNAFERGP